MKIFKVKKERLCMWKERNGIVDKGSGGDVTESDGDGDGGSIKTGEVDDDRPSAKQPKTALFPSSYVG